MFPSAVPGPLFFHLQPGLRRLAEADADASLAGLFAAANLSNGAGRPLRLVPPVGDGLGYEERVWERGEVATRPGDRHDGFNALVWMAFPRAKAALNAGHLAAAADRTVAQPGVRGSRRDALTHLDECGVIVASEARELLDLIREFRWKTLFWERRGTLPGKLGFYVFGHASCAQLCAPFRGLTGKAVLFEVPAGWHGRALPERLADLDARLAAAIAGGFPATPGELHPLPLLGIPGVVPESERAAYYDDLGHFRPGRRGRPVPR